MESGEHHCVSSAEYLEDVQLVVDHERLCALVMTKGHPKTFVVDQEVRPPRIEPVAVSNVDPIQSVARADTWNESERRTFVAESALSDSDNDNNDCSKNASCISCVQRNCQFVVMTNNERLCAPSSDHLDDVVIIIDHARICIEMHELVGFNVVEDQADAVPLGENESIDVTSTVIPSSTTEPSIINDKIPEDKTHTAVINEYSVVVGASSTDNIAFSSSTPAPKKEVDEDFLTKNNKRTPQTDYHFTDVATSTEKILPASTSSTTVPKIVDAHELAREYFLTEKYEQTTSSLNNSILATSYSTSAPSPKKDVDGSTLSGNDNDSVSVVYTQNSSLFETSVQKEEEDLSVTEGLIEKTTQTVKSCSFPPFYEKSTLLSGMTVAPLECPLVSHLFNDHVAYLFISR